MTLCFRCERCYETIHGTKVFDRSCNFASPTLSENEKILFSNNFAEYNSEVAPLNEAFAAPKRMDILGKCRET